MANNTIKTRIQLKNDTEANWNSAVLSTDSSKGTKESGNSFIPLKGEVIVYSAENNNDILPVGRTTLLPFSRFKVGDGVTNVADLPFSGTEVANNVANSLILKINTPSSITEGTNTYTFNGSAAKTLDIIAGSNINLITGEGSVTIANSYSLPTAAVGTKGGIKVDGGGLAMNGEKISHSNSVTAKTNYGSTATTANANGGTIILTDIQYDAQGHITASTDRTITLSQTTYDAEKGISLSGGKFGHSNTAIAAQTTQAIYPIKIDTYGHITAYGDSITPITSIAGQTGSSITANDLRAALGLSNIMHFLGITTTDISSGTPNTTAIITIDNNNVTAIAGDVVLYGAQEYVWGNNKWNLLGDEGSYKVKQTAFIDNTGTADEQNTSTSFIYSFSQNANGNITDIKTRALPIASTSTAGIVQIGTDALNAAAGNHTHNYLTAIGWDSTNKKITQSVNGAAAANILEIAGDKGITITGASGKVTISHSHTNITAKSAYGSTATTASANGGTIIVTDVQYDVQGHITAATDRTITLSQVLYSDFKASGSNAAAGLVPSPGTTAGTTKYLREDATWQVPPDTKNTAGSTNSIYKLFLIGATSQATNLTTNSYQYTYAYNGLLSSLKLGLNLNGTEKARMEWNDTDQSIDFVFE